jgi:hypothetical protein
VTHDELDIGGGTTMSGYRLLAALLRVSIVVCVQLQLVRKLQRLLTAVVLEIQLQSNPQKECYKGRDMRQRSDGLDFGGDLTSCSIPAKHEQDALVLIRHLPDGS